MILTRAHKTCIYSKKQRFDAKSAQNLHILKTINILIPKVHKTSIYSKKSKVFIVKSHQTCIYSLKKQKIKTNSCMPVSPT